MHDDTQRDFTKGGPFEVTRKDSGIKRESKASQDRTEKKERWEKTKSARHLTTGCRQANGPMKLCISCGIEFSPIRKTQTVCKPSCRNNCFLEKSGARIKGISNGTIGAISELKAAGELMKLGFECYRALSPSSSCDLVAIKDGKIYRFEVRTGIIYPNGNMIWGKCKMRAENYAVFAHSSDTLFLIPEIPIPVSL